MTSEHKALLIGPISAAADGALYVAEMHGSFAHRGVTIVRIVAGVEPVVLVREVSVGDDTCIGVASGLVYYGTADALLSMPAEGGASTIVAPSESCTGIGFDTIVTAQRAGFYKPHPRPYRLALDELGVEAQDCLFVAGSPYDLFGAAGVGLSVFWHDRIGMMMPPGAPPPLMHHNSLRPLRDLLLD